MKHFSMLVGFVLLTIMGDVQARLYKCTDASGAVTYSQTECPGQSMDEMRVTPSRDQPARPDQQAIIDHCTAWLSPMMKDPGSLRVETAGEMVIDTIVYAGKKILAYRLPLWINAKNSYGGYVGAKLYYCYLGQHDQKVLRVEKG